MAQARKPLKGFYIGLYRVIQGLYWDNGKENGNYNIIVGYILGLYRGSIGIMEKNMEISIMGFYRDITGFCRDRDPLKVEALEGLEGVPGLRAGFRNAIEFVFD